MVCPVCESECSRACDWCPACGSYLGLLKRQPKRIHKCIAASILLGSALFLALGWRAFAPLVTGGPVGATGIGFWLEFALATFFLTLGLTARRHLRLDLRLLRRGEPPTPFPTESEPRERRSSGSRY